MSARTKKYSKSKQSSLAKALAGLGLDLPEISFIRRDGLSARQAVTVHEVDLTPEVFDPEIGTGGGIRARCFSNNAIDIGGKAVTDSAGRATWKLSDFVCKSGGTDYIDPVSFVATAMADSAVLMTAQTASTGGDLVVNVFSWNTNGTPAPNVRYFWRCWVMAVGIIDA